jgi:hypothetical protein
LIRSKGKGGIDWYRHQKTILEPLLFPFAKECNDEAKRKGKKEALVMEDNAAPHAAR